MGVDIKPIVFLSSKNPAFIPGFVRYWTKKVGGLAMRNRRADISVQRAWRFALILLSFPFLSNAQVISKSVTLQDGTKGQIRYTAVEFSGHTLKHGGFRFQAVEQDVDNDKSFVSLEYEGTYNKGLKDGEWTYRKAIVQKSGEPTVNGYVLQQSVEGEELVISGNFNKGQAVDVWVSLRRRIVDGKAADTIEYVLAEFKAGNLFGRARGYVNELNFEGAFGETGLLTESWVFKGKHADRVFEERRQYQNGYLEEHTINTRQKSTKLLHPDLLRTSEDTGLWEPIVLSASVVKVLLESNLLFDFTNESELRTQLSIVRTSNEVMYHALQAFGKRNGTDIWAEFEGSEPMGGPRMMVRRFPFTPRETTALENSQSRLTQITITNQDFFNDPIVDVGRFAYEDVAFSYELLSQYKRVAENLGGAIEMLQDPTYQYVNRALLFRQMGLTSSFPDSITYEFDDTLRARAWLFPWQGPLSFLSIAEIDSQLTTIALHLRQLIQHVDLTLEDYKRESLLSAIEVRIIEKREEAIGLFEQKIRAEDFNDYHKQLAEHIFEFVMGGFKSYARLSPREKLDASDSVLTCFTEVIQLYEELRKQPLREKSLTELYTRTVWNAYTFTYMDELVKERLFKAYEEELLPAITNDLIAHLSCGNISKKSKNYAAVYKRMQTLREQDTKVEERQLRKSGGVANVIAIFNFELRLGGGN